MLLLLLLLLLLLMLLFVRGELQKNEASDRFPSCGSEWKGNRGSWSRVPIRGFLGLAHWFLSVP